jgi:hypothetical protein
VPSSDVVAPPPAKPPTPARETPPPVERPAPPAVQPPPPVTPPAAKTRIKSPPPVEPPAAPVAVAAPQARRAATDLTFANAALLWIVPVVLISFLAGVLPDFMQPDERTPLLHAHYLSLATSAVDLVKTSREPAVPIDTVTNALRRQAGVTSARIVGADGRVLAPLDQAGTTVPPPPASADGAPTIVENRDGVEVQVAARTADGRPVLVAMTVDPERIHPSPPGSPLSTVLLLMSLGAAWLVARRLTSIADSRLSRLGEEIELMATRQITIGRDPFSLTGGQRILDAVTFALSSAGRVASDAPSSVEPVRVASSAAPATASIDADAAFRIVSVDAGCAGLLGLDPRTAPGKHLIDALPDQAVSDEVMRLLTMATSDGVVSGEAVSVDRGIRLGIDVTRGGGAAPLSIRFKRL